MNGNAHGWKSGSRIVLFTGSLTVEKLVGFSGPHFPISILRITLTSHTCDSDIRY